MANRNARHDSPGCEASAAVWNTLASRAGYLDAEYPTIFETAARTEAGTGNYLSWQIGPYLKRLATLIQEWSRH